MNDNAMIAVTDLTKRYAGRTAVAGISFTGRARRDCRSARTEWRGQKHDHADSFVFPAGDSGTVRVAGFDVFRQSEEVRRRIGYMPETIRCIPKCACGNI